MLVHLKTYPVRDEYDLGFNAGVEKAGRHIEGIIWDMMARKPDQEKVDWDSYSEVADYDEERITYLIEFEERVTDLLKNAHKETS